MFKRGLRRALGSVVIGVSVFGCGVSGLGDREEAAVAQKKDALCGVVVDPTRSLAVTDPTALSRFSFQRTMDQILTTGDVTTGQTSLDLYKQWWDTQNDDATGVTSTRHCNDTNPNQNGFPIECPRAEGALASTNPFVAGNDHFTPVALFNRFDLAPSDGSNCGEYRIVYAKDSGLTNSLNRTFIIFEAALPNPNPSAGIEGCRPVAEFWALLSSDADATSRATKLENFYYNGLTGFAPVVDAAHYGGTTSSYVGSAGQIRTNQFMQFNWLLREFKVQRVCRRVLVKAATTTTTITKAAIIDPIIEPIDPIEPALSCSLVMNHVTVKANPFGPLFGTSGVAGSADFQTEFVANMGSLLAGNANDIGLLNSEQFNAGDSFSQGSQNNYATQAAGNAALLANITAALPAGSGLNSTHVLNRATTQSCAGCHQLSNGANLGTFSWPSSAGFVHVTENRTLSSALTGTFLPRRKTVLENFVNTCVVRKLTVAPSLTISGKLVGAAN